METIKLRRDNVVKEAASEEAAAALEQKGFVRDGAEPTGNKADERTQAYEKELADTRGQLEEASGRIRELEQELEGTREQLEAAVKKNVAAKKEK
jgi:hypothetical protein